jgi:hypothetical protein
MVAERERISTLTLFKSLKKYFRSDGDEMEDRTMLRHEMQNLQESFWAPSEVS